MNDYSDRTLASRMLHIREHGPPPFQQLFYQSSRSYLLLAATQLGGAALFAMVELWPLVWVTLGTFLGTILRDIGWFRAQRKVLPFSLKTTDWAKVETLAAADTLSADHATCAECKGVFKIQEMIAHRGVYVCASCKPRFLQKLTEGAELPKESKRGVPLWLVLVVCAAIAVAFVLAVPWIHPHHRSH